MTRMYVTNMAALHALCEVWSSWMVLAGWIWWITRWLVLLVACNSFPQWLTALMNLISCAPTCDCQTCLLNTHSTAAVGAENSATAAADPVMDQFVFIVTTSCALQEGWPASQCSGIGVMWRFPGLAVHLTPQAMYHTTICMWLEVSKANIGTAAYTL